LPVLEGESFKVAIFQVPIRCLEEASHFGFFDPFFGYDDLFLVVGPLAEPYMDICSIRDKKPVAQPQFFAVLEPKFDIKTGEFLDLACFCRGHNFSFLNDVI